MNILKQKISSLCSVCYKEIPAQIYEEDGKVYISKNCQKDGDFKFLIEKDALVYKKLMNKDYVQEKMPIHDLMLSVTHSCNLNCPICCLPNRTIPDLALEDIKKVISNSKVRLIRLAGGEPTLREDLPEIIRYIRQEGKLSALVTNGLKLINKNYVKELKKAGLDFVCFSFNGFNDKIYNKINGRNLLKIKLEALKNIMKEKIDISLSVMLVRGINEKELRKIFHFCIKNSHFIYELRIRNTTAVGKYIDNDVFSISEILEQLSAILRIDKYKLFNKFFNEHNHSPCRLNMDFYSLLTIGDMYEKIKNPKIKKFILGWNLLLMAGFLNSVRLLWKKMRRKKINFLIRIRCRFDNYNIDLNEIQRCPSLHLLSDGKESLPLCQALVLNEKTVIL